MQMNGGYNAVMFSKSTFESGLPGSGELPTSRLRQQHLLDAGELHYHN